MGNKLGPGQIEDLKGPKGRLNPIEGDRQSRGPDLSFFPFVILGSKEAENLPLITSSRMAACNTEQRYTFRLVWVATSGVWGKGRSMTTGASFVAFPGFWV